MTDRLPIGVSFPQTEIGADPARIGDYVQTIEGLGLDHLSVIDHVLGTGTPIGPAFASSYTSKFMFHEPFTLLAYLAALTERLTLATAILILPQRQAALVAKQAAEVDVLSRGRMRLGVGLGWNAPEFQALGQNFADRGRRIEEQIAVMRRLWTEDLVTFSGADHRLEDIGINPAPVQRPIPVWIGALGAKAVRRAGRIADGWFIYPRQAPDGSAADLIAAFRQAATEAGRDPASLGIDATVYADSGGPDDWLKRIEVWRELGATQITFRTTECGLAFPDQHLSTMQALMAAYG